jgi:uncharacterized protein YkwD
MMFRGACLCVLFMACATVDSGSADRNVVFGKLPVTTTMVNDNRATRAADALCSRGGDGVVTIDIRQQAGLYEGTVLGILRDSDDDLEAAVLPLIERYGLGFGGVHRPTDGGPGCRAFVGGVRTVRPAATLPGVLAAPGMVLLPLSLPAQTKGIAFVTKPDGYVTRLDIPEDGVVEVKTVLVGSYTIEVVIDPLDAKGASKGNPSIGLLWSFIVERAADPPAPIVLFPDAGHDDQALTHRAEALVQRLRNTHLLETVKLSPWLSQVAQTRSQAIATAGTLSHRIDGQTPVDALNAVYADSPDPRGPVSRIAEVQAQASTLHDAWTALLDSPGHRYELLSSSSTHAGVGVVRGQDAIGRPTVSLVVVLGRRAPTADPMVAQQAWVERLNDDRQGRGLGVLAADEVLQRMARRLARACASSQTLSEQALGGPIAQMTLTEEPSFTKVVPLLVRTDDPSMMPFIEDAYDIDANTIGSAVVQQDDGMLVAVVLIGVRG